MRKTNVIHADLAEAIEVAKEARWRLEVYAYINRATNNFLAHKDPKGDLRLEWKKYVYGDTLQDFQYKFSEWRKDNNFEAQAKARQERRVKREAKKNGEEPKQANTPTDGENVSTGQENKKQGL